MDATTGAVIGVCAVALVALALGIVAMVYDRRVSVKGPGIRADVE